MIVWFMIYGYFCVDKNMVMRDGIKRAVHMRNPMLFYAVVLSILFVIPQQGIQMVEVLKALFPVSSNMWYFMTNYIILTLFVPFINKALESFEKRDYTILLANLLVICSVWRVLSTDIPGAKEVYDLKNVMLAGSKNLMAYFFMYLLGGYIRRYVYFDKQTGKKLMWLWSILYFGIAGIHMLMVICMPSLSAEIIGRTDGILVIIQGISLLMFFREIKFRSRIVNQISKGTLGVYLIHEFPAVRKLIWNSLLPFHDIKFYEAHHYTYIFYILAACVCIFVVCNGLDQIRMLLWKVMRSAYRKIEQIKWNDRKQIG